MKYLKYTILSILIVLVLFITYTLTNPTSPFETVSFTKGDLKLEVEYSRPYKKNRLIFGDKNENALVPYNEYWRTGANASTIFSTNKDIQFGDKSLPAGKYRLYTIPNLKIWKININSESSTFFAISEPDYSKDLFSIEIESTEIENSLEQFTIDFVSTNSTQSLRMRWDKVEVLIPIK